uniref:ABC transporter family protein n=1 Tax=Rhizophora mucronata TaxID=61149 RepID=A0A2P2M5X1_RHIMU
MLAFLSFLFYDCISLPTFRAFQGLCINEFRGLQFDHEHSFDIETGEQVKPHDR